MRINGALLLFASFECVLSAVLVIVQGQICHLARNQATDSGWQLLSPFGTQDAKEVAAGTAYAASSKLHELNTHRMLPLYLEGPSR